jgi:Oxidoreductase molybdopterin binding domain
MSCMRFAIIAIGLVAASASAQTPCPVEGIVPAGTMLTVRSAGGLQNLSAADLSALPMAERVQRRTLSSAGDTPAPTAEVSLRYGGVLLRDVLARAMPGDLNRRAVRVATIEALATDGYRAVFSWGELFNNAAGDHVLVITTQDGLPLNADQGPLALRALADLRPGPRHVRNLCAVVVRMPSTTQ